MGKGKGRSIASRGATALPKNRGTGFEGGYADPPLTPAEHAEEMEIYDLNRPFHERIEECIQRYSARRRLPQDRSHFFSKYLYLGGIDTTQRQFTGTAQHVKGFKEDDYTVDEIREITANEFLSRGGDAKGPFFSPDAPEHWDVDFAGVVAGFLGSHLAETTFSDTTDVGIAADTIKNFLNYILHHNVCPEYSDNVKEAIEICKRSEVELREIAIAGCAFPGDFNLACRVLFCSSGVPHSSGNFVSDHQLYEDKKADELSDGEMVTAPGAVPSCMAVPIDFNPQLVFQTTVALHMPEHIAVITTDRVAGYPRVTKTFDETYEISALLPADASLADVYAGITQHDATLRPVEPVGHVILVPSIIEDGWDNHPTLAEGRADNPGAAVIVYLEHAQMEKLRVGWKLRATICHLELGGGATLDFVKEVAQIVPSFHVFLPQQLMMHYKPPRPDTRLPPSAEDPEVEERRLAAIAEDEEREYIKEMRKLDPELDQEVRELEDVEALRKVMARTEI